MRDHPTPSTNSGPSTRVGQRARNCHSRKPTAVATAAVSMACPLGKLYVNTGLMLTHKSGRGRAKRGLRTCVRSMEPPTAKAKTRASLRCFRRTKPSTIRSPSPIMGPVSPTLVKPMASLSKPGEAC